MYGVVCLIEERFDVAGKFVSLFRRDTLSLLL